MLYHSSLQQNPSKDCVFSPASAAQVSGRSKNVFFYLDGDGDWDMRCGWYISCFFLVQCKESGKASGNIIFPTISWIVVIDSV